MRWEILIYFSSLFLLDAVFSSSLFIVDFILTILTGKSSSFLNNIFVRTRLTTKSTPSYSAAKSGYKSGPLFRYYPHCWQEISLQLHRQPRHSAVRLINNSEIRIPQQREIRRNSLLADVFIRVNYCRQ